jgi:hypothetical protein
VAIHRPPRASFKLNVWYTINRSASIYGISKPCFDTEISMASIATSRLTITALWVLVLVASSNTQVRINIIFWLLFLAIMGLFFMMK